MLAELLSTFRLNRWLWQARRALPVPLAGEGAGSVVKVAGTIAALDADALVSPFTRMPCVAWVARIDERSFDAPSRGIAYEDEQPTFRERHSQTMCAPFWLDVDGGGRLRVDDGPTTLSISLADVSEHPRVNDENPTFAAFLRSAGIPPTLHMGIAGEHRFAEALLRAGDRISVYGTLMSAQVIVAGGYRGVRTEQLSLRGDDARPLVIASSRSGPAAAR